MTPQPDTRRSLEEIGATGAAWITETELEWLLSELERAEAALREALACEKGFVSKDGAHSATVVILERALSAGDNQ